MKSQPDLLLKIQEITKKSKINLKELQRSGKRIRTELVKKYYRKLDKIW